jgi:hypothetical protein
LGQTKLYTTNRGAWLPASWEDERIYLEFDGAGALTDAAIVEEENFWRWTANANSTLRSITLGFGSGSLTMKQLASADSNTDPIGSFTYADPASTGLSYQTFGWWLKPQGDIVGERWGSFSVGAPTPTQAIPTSGTAQFAGALGATGVDTGFGDIAAPVTINVDFGGRTAGFSSVNFRDAQGNVYAGTALTGTLTYGSQQSTLHGELTSTAYAGPANGRFYGPAAEEIGGSFVLTPTDPTANGRVVGGFGAKR